MLCPTTSNWTLTDYERYYENTCSLLVHLAKKATTFKITTSLKSFTAWSPSISFLYKYIHFLIRRRTHLTTISTQNDEPPTHLLSNIHRFLSKYYNITKLIDGISHYRYRDIIHKLYPNFPDLNLTHNLPPPSPSELIAITIRKCKQYCHAKHQRELRSRINKITQQHEENRKAGKVKNVIQWILNKPSTRRFTTVVTTSNQIKALPKKAHEATLNHFTNHFQAHPWIHLSQLNAQTPEGEELRNSLLEGTWRTLYPTLTHSLAPRFRTYASLYLDNFKYKATLSQQLDLHELTNIPIPFSSFHQSLMHKNGHKAPGPSGLTISILQATPITVLEHLHNALHEMWNHKHIPPSWQKREMALLPKKPNSTTLADLRPLMLLEVLRKLWLSLILRPISTYLIQHNLLCPYQCGGIPNSGTEDSILQLVNTLEDSTERAENLEILAFDKAKAFDSPGRIGGIALAWQRLGLPQSIAFYIANCDENNQIYPRTPHYLRSKTKHPSLAFHATMGTPQGCSSASISYIAVEDIILTTFQSNLDIIDPYLSRDPSGILFPQPPTQFVDDTYIFSRSTAGAQNAIDLLQTAEPLLNIRINPTKTRHFSIQWSPPHNNSSPYFTMNTPAPTLTAFSADGTINTIPPIPLSSPTRVLGAFLSPDNSTTITKDIKSEISRLRYAILKKKATLPTIWQVLKQCIYPKFTYILKFTNLSMYDLNTISASLRDLIRKKSHATHLPNALLFSANATPYSLPYYDLMSHTLREKERTTLRMLAGAPFSRQIIHCLLERGTRLISEHHTMTNIPIGCPLLHNYTTQVDPTHYSWALSLIQYLQIARSNIFTTTPTPATLPNIQCTQTALHSFYSHSLDIPLTLDDIFDFESSYHIHFIEELFPYPPVPPQTFLPTLHSIFPRQFHNFITRILTTAYTSNSPLTLGKVTLREHMMLHIPSLPNCTYIEGLIYPNIQTHSQHLLAQQWTAKTHKLHLTKLYINHTTLHPATKHTIPLTTFLTTRYIRSGIGYTTTNQVCTAIPLNQLIVPRHVPTFHDLYAPPTIKCNLHPTICMEWRSHSTSTSPVPVYTDGSLTQQPPQLTHQPINTVTQIHSAIVFYNKQTAHLPWPQRCAIGIRIKFPISTSSSNYTAEVLGASIASALPGNINTHIYTDALGLVNSFYKTLANNQTTVSILIPHLKRDYTDTGILYDHLINHSHRLTLTHVKAHQEDSPQATKTEHGTGNRLADLVAQGKNSLAQQLCPNLKIFTYSLHDIIKQPPTPQLVFIGQNPNQTSFSIDHPSNTFQRYHTALLNEWLDTTRPTSSLLSHLQWHDLTWNLAGTLISKYTNTNTSLKTFLFKVLYDSLPNKYNQHKYSHSKSITSQRPLCPLCLQSNDSLSHTLCQCTHPLLQSLRTKTIDKLHRIPNLSPLWSPLIDTQRTLLDIITKSTTNTEPDHRCLLGLLIHDTLSPPQSVSTHLKQAFLPILNLTIPYISDAWKIYCNETHPNLTSTPLLTPHLPPASRIPRLIIISGNNATLSTTTINDHQPRAYFRKNRTQKRKSPAILSPSQTSISRYFSLTQPSQSTRSFPLPQTHPTSSPQPHNDYTFPSKHYKSPQKLTDANHQHSPTPTHSPNSYTHLTPLPDETPCSPQNLPLLPPYYQFDQPPHLQNCTPAQILSRLQLFSYDVPANGDCFYNAIQLYLHHLPTDPFFISIPQLRSTIAKLFSSTTTGSNILKHYHQTSQVITTSILPSLNPSLYPQRDIAAADYVIAATATLLHSPITVYHYCPHTQFSSTTFHPHPLPKSHLLTQTPLPPVYLWCERSHFHLLTKHPILIPHPIRAPPPLPVLNHTTHGKTTRISAPPNYISLPHCPHQNPLPPPTHPTSFCTTNCHPHCPNHYNSFRPTPLKIYSPPNSPQHVLTAIGVPPNTPLIEITSTISTTPSPTTFPITDYAHSNAFTTHPLLPLLSTTLPPNCYLQPLLIPDHHRQMKLFLVSLTTIPPYTTLSLRPPPQPPPPPEPPPPQSLIPRRSSTQRTPSRITDFFKSTRR